MSDPVDITIRYFDGCPNWRTADERVRAALAFADVEAKVDYKRVEDAAQAEELRFLGSPTILIDGHDPFDERASGYGLGCRLYASGSG